MKIYGAGLAGLLAAHILRRYKPTIYERQPYLPNNHEALLRFRTDAVSQATGIPFKKVTVQKAIYHHGELQQHANLQMNNEYSFKVTGEVMGRSIVNVKTCERWIAPPDFIRQLADGLDIKFNSALSSVHSFEEPIISTIPMPALMELAKWNDAPKFNYRPVTILTANIVSPTCDVYQTIYFPGPDPWYRASITGDHVMVEIPGNLVPSMSPADVILGVLRLFGIAKAKLTLADMKQQKYGKIAPIDDDLRKEFILAMSDRYNVYSVGRYATWRQILLDDVVHDVTVVENFIRERNRYQAKLAHNA